MIALDIETTGLDERENCMVSLGAIHVESGRELYKECRVYPDTKFSNKAMEINGFTIGDVTLKSKPFAHEIYKTFCTWCTDHIGGMPAQGGNELLIGQNLPSFDIRFLKHYHFNVLDNKYKWLFGHRYIDLHSYVYASIGLSMSMDETLEYLGEDPEPHPHNALTGANCVAIVKYGVDGI